MMIILKTLAILIVTVALMATMMSSAKADDNIQKYVAFYNSLCNVQVSNNMSADLPHTAMNIKITKHSSAKFSTNGISFTSMGPMNEVFEISMDSTQSVVSLKYEF